MDTTTLLLLGAAAYFLFLRVPPRAGAPITGQFGPGGTAVTGPGISYRSGPGGTQIAIDPNTLRSLFGSPPSGTTWGAGPPYAPPGPAYPGDAYGYGGPEYLSPFDDPTYVEMSPGIWVPPDFNNDPCFYVPDPSCGAVDGDLSSVW